MKRLLIAFAIALPLLFIACSRETDNYNPTYDSAVCNGLATRIDHRDSLTQADYTAMIGQTEAIIKYLIEEHKRIESEPSDVRSSDWRVLYADPEYMERFGYFFTLGSALYRADTHHLFDARNQKLYASLDDYNTRLAKVTMHEE